MLLYYTLAWSLVKIRRGFTGYFPGSKTAKKPPLSFYCNIFIILLALAAAYPARIHVAYPEYWGIGITALVWATVNAASEQLLWIYLFEAWDLAGIFRSLRYGKLLRRSIGLLLFSTFVGFIHTLFWVQFLHTVDASQPTGVLFVLLTSVSGYMHLIVWRKSGNMLYTFLPHFLLNLVPLFWTGYSIIPYLWKF